MGWDGTAGEELGGGERGVVGVSEGSGGVSCSALLGKRNWGLYWAGGFTNHHTKLSPAFFLLTNFPFHFQRRKKKQ
jgi:hypothetical protein